MIGMVSLGVTRFIGCRVKGEWDRDRARGRERYRDVVDRIYKSKV